MYNGSWVYCELCINLWVVTNAHDQNNLEPLTVFVPRDIFSNKISKAFRGMVQSSLTSVRNNLKLWKGMQKQIPEPLHES